MAEEKFFLRRKKRVALADDGAQRRRHLQRDEQEDDDPDIHARLRLGVGVGKSVLHEPHAEQRGDEPEQQVQKAHPRERFGGLRENPRHRREADEQNRHQHQQPREQAANFREPCLRAAQAGEDVETRQTDGGGDEKSRRDFHRRGPELFMPGKSSGHDAINHRANQCHEQHPADQFARAGLAQLKQQSSRVAQQRLNGGERIRQRHALGGIIAEGAFAGCERRRGRRRGEFFVQFLCGIARRNNRRDGIVFIHSFVLVFSEFNAKAQRSQDAKQE